MSAYQCWVAQRERLRESLLTSGDASGAAYLTRHALAQVEQNTMAEQPDDLLRQQTGILFSCCKTSLGLLDISVATQIWVAQSQAKKTRKHPGKWLMLVACFVQLAIGMYAYWFARLPLLWMPLAVSVAATVFGWVTLTRAQKSDTPSDDHLKVTAKPDTGKLFAAIDVQMKAIDRYINDFAYLNEQNALRDSILEGKTVALLAELMQAVYECEGDARDEAVSAAERMLECVGVRAVAYSLEDARLFNVLPSVTETRTLTPALLAQKDGMLLSRGTAAVLQTQAMQDAPIMSDGAEPSASRGV